MRRDHLIADWRDRLAAAETEPVGSSPRRAWLVRVRTRLYRFLLSLYGDGVWRADAPPTTQPPGPAVFDATLAEQLTGKPAKDVGKIRSVLKTVANSQDHRPAAGSLTADEVIAHCWFVVATSRSGLSLTRCQELLQHARIESREIARGDEMVIEVQGPQRYEAMALLEERRAELKLKPRRLVVLQPKNEGEAFTRMGRQQPVSFGTVVLLFVFPLACLCVFLAIIYFQPNAQRSTETLTALYRSIMSLLFVCGAATVWAWWRTRLETLSSPKCSTPQEQEHGRLG